MLKIFDMVPGWVWALLLGLALLISGINYTRMAAAKMELANYKTEVAENTRKAEAEVRAKEQAMQKQTERIAHEAAKKQTVLVARAADADRAAGSLRDEIARLNARPAPADPELAAFAREASVARELLGACTAQYRGVAQAADELRDQVSGLQDYAANVCKGAN